MNEKDFLIIMYGRNESINLENAIFMSQLKRNFVYIDSYSTDDTLKILKQKKIKFILHEFTNWPTLRKVGYQYAKENNYPWILMLDADEIINEKTLKYLDTLDKRNIDSYSLSFKMIFNGKFMNYASHRPRIRFYSVERTYPKGDSVIDFIYSKRNKNLSKKHFILNRDKTDFINLVKKQIQKVENSSIEIFNPIQEHSNIKKFFFRILHKNLLLKSFAIFFYNYVLKLAFLDGKAGLYYCFNYAFIFHFLMSSKDSN